MQRLRKLLIVVFLFGYADVSATEMRMLDGHVRFNAPNTWPLIMQTDGDPELRVFQVPDPSPTGTSSLARITVSATKVDGAAGFQAYLNQAASKASALTDYQAEKNPRNGIDGTTYSARENGVLFAYHENYWFKNGHALQLRCVRPARSQAGAAWQSAFDRGCAMIAAELAH